MGIYQTSFNGSTADILAAIREMPGDFEKELPGFSIDDLRRIFSSISNALLKIDKKIVRYPENLIYNTSYLPDSIVDYMATIAGQIPNGAQHFVKNILPQVVSFKDLLEKAVGVDSSRFRSAVSNQLSTLDQIISQSQALLSDIDTLKRRASTANHDIDKSKSLIEQRVGDISASAKLVEGARAQAERLVGDAARKDSLASIAKSVRLKSDELAKLFAEAEKASMRSIHSADEVTVVKRRIEEIEVGLDAIKVKADNILKGATQAGLAGAYKGERDRLAKEQRNITFVFYGGIVAIVIYATCFIIPVLTDLLEKETGEMNIGKVALILAIRLGLIAPIVWALIFTNSRFSKLELMQMDYAAKANTALAYSGYNDELGVDTVLSAKLKDGLLVRFLEHPERLLRKSPLKEKITAGPSGVAYESESKDAEKSHPSADE